MSAPRKCLLIATKTGKKYTHVWDDCKDIAKKAWRGPGEVPPT